MSLAPHTPRTPMAWDAALAIIVPYRPHPHEARERQLQMLSQALPQLLRPHIDPHTLLLFCVVQQSEDGRRFNRGKCCNVGMLLALQAAAAAGIKDTACVVVFHDVDLLPDAELARHYTALLRTPGGVAVHLAAPWGRYAYPGFLGGIVAAHAADVARANGFPNTMWGYGGEDDVLRWRLEEAAGVTITPPPSGRVTDLQDVTRDARAAEDKTRHCPAKREIREVQHSTWKRDGVSSCAFRVLRRHEALQVLADGTQTRDGSSASGAAPVMLRLVATVALDVVFTYTKEYGAALTSAARCPFEDELRGVLPPSRVAALRRYEQKLVEGEGHTT